MVSLHDVFAEPALSRPPVTIAATDQATYLEDMAKAEALDAWEIQSARSQWWTGMFELTTLCKNSGELPPAIGAAPPSSRLRLMHLEWSVPCQMKIERRPEGKEDLPIPGDWAILSSRPIEHSGGPPTG